MACSAAGSAWATTGAEATEATRTLRLGLGLGVGRAAGAGAGGGGNSVMVAVSGGRSSLESEKRTSHCVIARCNKSDAANASSSMPRGRKREDHSLPSIALKRDTGILSIVVPAEDASFADAIAQFGSPG